MSNVHEIVEQETPLELFDWYYKDSDGKWVSVTWHDLHTYFDEGKITLATMVAWQGLIEPGFPFQYIDAEFFYEFAGTIQHVYTEAELHNAFSEGKIRSSTMIWGKLLPAKGIQYDSYRFVDVVFDPDIKQFIETRRGHSTTVLSGPNDSGKTLALKLLRRELGSTTNFLACNRFYHMDSLNPVAEQDSQHKRRHENFVTQLYQRHQNTEDNDFPLPQVISQLKDAQRDILFGLCSEMLGKEFCLKQVDPENRLSQYYIDVDGQNLAISSTGTRLLLMIMAACLDDRYSILLIDEPELGLSPSLQAALAKHLLLHEKRQTYLPHLRQLFIATHSHLFLDHGDISNNFVIARDRNRIAIRKVESISAYHDLQFNMLGNSLEALFLPSAIVIVEGETDHDYIKRIFQIFLPDKQVSVVTSGGDSGTLKQLHVISSSLGAPMMSPYRSRLFVLLDSRHTVKKSGFSRHGIPPENIIVLEKNGIEYYYPEQILAKIFACKPTEVQSLLETDNNVVRVRDIEMTKKDLCQSVLDQLTPESEIPTEIRDKLLCPIIDLLE